MTVYARYELMRTFRNRRFVVFSLGFPLVLCYAIAGPNRDEANLGGSGIAAPCTHGRPDRVRRDERRPLDGCPHRRGARGRVEPSAPADTALDPAVLPDQATHGVRDRGRDDRALLCRGRQPGRPHGRCPLGHDDAARPRGARPVRRDRSPDGVLGGARIDPRTDGRPDPRPSVRERAPQLGDLRADFDFAQAPRPPVLLAPRP
jgi:hypothetical protein